MRTDAEILNELAALAEGDSNDDEIETLWNVVRELLCDRRQLLDLNAHE